MFDGVPLKVWLLLLIAISAAMPARYVFRYLRHAPNRREITRPPEDLGWRSARTFWLSLVALVLLVGLAMFIFTPAAEATARSPHFFPLLMIGFGAWMLVTVWRGHINGSIEPMSRGSFGPFSRHDQPKRFWASMVWNTIWGVGLIALAVATHFQTEADELSAACYNQQNLTSADDQIVACTTLIDKNDATDPGQLAAYYSLRGRIYHDRKDWNRAFADYSQAIEVAPHDSAYARYNRAFVYLYRYQLRPAADDLTVIIEANPNGAEAMGAYAQRAWIYEHLGEEAHAAADRAKFETLRAANPVIIRTEAGSNQTG